MVSFMCGVCVNVFLWLYREPTECRNDGRNLLGFKQRWILGTRQGRGHSIEATITLLDTKYQVISGTLASIHAEG